MLSDYTPMPTLATTDVERARAFYEGVLGFVADESPGGGAVRFGAGAGSFLVYPSSFAGTNQATAMSIQVPMDRFDEEAAAMRAAGIEFDEFEWEGVVWEDGVAVMEGMKSAWFKDPDGNIVNLGAVLD